MFNAEWSPAYDQPDLPANAKRASGEGFNSGASRIGFRGEEKMGGGLASWYQCETELGIFPRDTGITVCDRNSAIGLKGSFGNFYIGTWDSPLKKMSGVTRITNETGWLGTQGMTLRQGEGSPNLSNRNTNSFNYDTPNLGGFTGTVQITTKQASLDAPDDVGTATTEGRNISIGGQYATGRLAVVAAYTKREKNLATGGLDSSEDTGVLAGVKYEFGPVELGFSYARRESDPTATTSGKRDGYNLAGTWALGGPHSLIAGYSVAGELKGNIAALSGPDTGATQFLIGYKYGFSKRTVGTIGYVKLDNDTNGVYNLTDMASGSAAVTPGESPGAFVLSLIHSF